MTQSTQEAIEALVTTAPPESVYAIKAVSKLYEKDSGDADIRYMVLAQNDEHC